MTREETIKYLSKIPLIRLRKRQKRKRVSKMKLTEIAEDFKKFSEGTRSDFHEPDEQEIYFYGCIGTMLDNAFGSAINSRLLQVGSHEVVIFVRKSEQDYQFNLADIFALAKIGATQLTRYQIVEEKGE